MLTLQPKSLDWALNQAELLGDSAIFPLPFEFEAIRNDWDELRKNLSQENILKWEVRPHRECLSPKTDHSFRIATHLDPLDWLIYTAAVYEMGQDLESYRMPLDEEVVFSWRFAPKSDGTMFSRGTNYRDFRKQSLELSGENDYEFVVVTDIADFFPNLYHHRIENALKLAAPQKTAHVKAVTRLLGAWREKQSFGIPVGPNASRLIAEVTIHDVDLALQGEGIVFARYADDFRMFCQTHKEAYVALATLADILWKNHGLTLAGEKSRILTVNEFEHQYALSEREAELEHMSETFGELIEMLGFDSWYEDIDYDDLNENARNIVDALNLEGLLREQLQSEQIDLRLVKFILRRLVQLQDSDMASAVLSKIDDLYPIAGDVMEYIKGFKCLTKLRRQQLGNKVLDLLSDSLVSHLEYNRMFMLNLFASNADWGSVDRLNKALNTSEDDFSKRKLILALGAAGQSQWFRRQKTNWQNMPPWIRRAYLRGASCMERDERDKWYDSIEGRLDQLELAIVKWSRRHPITTT